MIIKILHLYIIKILFLVLVISQLSLKVSSAQNESLDTKKDSINLNILIDNIKSIKDTNYIYAYEIAIEGLKKYRLDNNTVGRIRLLQLTAEIEFYYKGLCEQSIIHLNEMKYLSDSINYKLGKPWAELNMAHVYYYQKDLKKSRALFEEARKNAVLINDSIIVINALNGIADILYHQGNIDSALTMLYKCLNYAEHRKIFDSQMFIYDDIANIHQRLNNLDSSMYYYKKLLKVSEQENNKYGAINSEVNITYIQYLLNKSFNPILKLRNLQMQSKERGFYRLYYEIGYILSEVYEYYQMCNESISSYKEARSIEDSLTANEKIRRVAEIESNFYLEKKEFENGELNKLNEINILKLKNRRNLIAFILFILIQAIVLLYLLYRKYRTIKEQERKIYEQENEKITQKLDSKKRELAINTLKMYHANQLVDDLSIKLFKLRSKIRAKGKAAEELRSDIQLMLNEIRSNANSKIWEEVELSFYEANPSFMKWLNSNFPNLTSNEIKLCIFSILHLKTKDMSSILMKSNMSVQVARTRLRKKLMINDPNISLSGYLSRKYEEEN